MVSEVSQSVLEAAHELNVRDAKIGDAVKDGTYEQQKENFPDDDTVWAGIGGVKRKETNHGPGTTATGPYSRNRRILADIALCAGWSVDKTRQFERACIVNQADHRSSRSGIKRVGPDDFRHEKDDTPFTFEHISWSFLSSMIDHRLEQMDPEKRAVVRAGVINAYPGNSKEPKLVHAHGTKRKNVDLPEDEQVEEEQQKVDKDRRYRAALRGDFHENWETPDQVKRKLKTLAESGDPVFDTCNEVRRKINQHVKKTSVSRAQLARDLNEVLPLGDNVDARKLGSFLKKSGPNDGATSPVFYAAYVYFEKMRIKDGKGKSKTREEMEKVWGTGGMDRTVDKNQRVFCAGSERPHVDKYGKISIG